jgi:hypothetical protein
MAESGDGDPLLERFASVWSTLTDDCQRVVVELAERLAGVVESSTDNGG